MNTTGLVLGKYAPFHKGHQLVLETALRETARVICLIYDTPISDAPLQVRAGWIKRLYPQAALTVIPCWDGPDGYGLDPENEKRQNDYILKVLRERLRGQRITHFFSSEPYGASVARALGAKDCRVDEARARVPVSGTQIRANPFQHRASLAPEVYSDLITRVVFMGAMSTGKTTLAQTLAARYQTAWMPEYGREYWETHQKNRRIDLAAFDAIATGHLEREDRLIMEANKYLFVDTNAITTYVFAQDYHGRAPALLTTLAQKAQTRYDLFFLCEDDIPYDNTWDRSGDQKRHWFQRMVIADLAERRIPYIRLRGSLEERIAKVTAILARFRKFHSLAEAIASEDIT